MTVVLVRVDGCERRTTRVCARHVVRVSADGVAKQVLCGGGAVPAEPFEDGSNMSVEEELAVQT